MGKPTYYVWTWTEDGWWAIRIAGASPGADMMPVDRYTEARTRSEVDAMARDLIVVLLDVPGDTFEVAVRHLVDPVHRETGDPLPVYVRIGESDERCLAVLDPPPGDTLTESVTTGLIALGAVFRAAARELEHTDLAGLRALLDKLETAETEEVAGHDQP